MNEIEILKKITQNIVKTKDLEYKRSLLYSGYTSLLLSTHFFKLNIDLKEFLTPLLRELENIYPLNKNQRLILKDYVYKSRSLIISRVLRIIQKADSDSLIKLEENFSDFLQKSTVKGSQSTSSHVAKKGQKNSKQNSVDALFERFNRE
ncbi:hypothetical protein [Lactiplantibacillus plantarum]|uniref:hypothetical protein n=1 Tax=Lactiplantibacillus plantarum TaxID=1590 RepID=UPI0021A36899|nr:hypothetical protein [Lactiplantibacillus plantarum]MCT3206821.1 hypothetical protein [Lactiplantibacillus plantarum]MCT3219472.1 hypothetical protein [Lactiplantibacillus plantarum]WND30259.1 hypothetical protein RI127_11145 [Lactiplantibacillus plantarum]